MAYANRNGVRLFYTNEGAGDPPLLFVHGWCCDSTHWRRQLPAFRRDHRVVAVDLRGHGSSSKPEQDYTMDAFCQDLEWLIGKLGLRRPVVIGHSMGGVIALRLAGRRKRALSGVVIVDSPVYPKFDRAGRQQLNTIFDALEGPTYRAAARRIIDENFFTPASPPALRRRLTTKLMRTPQHVMSSAFRNLWLDNRALGKRVNAPSLFIDAGHPLDELERIQRAVNGIQIGRTVGAGHFNMMEAPGQFNAMLRAFLDRLRPADAGLQARARKAK
jgi:pimeloyl-ACP methyl ester carboxylesterase